MKKSRKPKHYKKRYTRAITIQRDEYKALHKEARKILADIGQQLVTQIMANPELYMTESEENGGHLLLPLKARTCLCAYFNCEPDAFQRFSFCGIPAGFRADVILQLPIINSQELSNETAIYTLPCGSPQ